MAEIVEKTIKELLELLGLEQKEVKEVLQMLLVRIGKESLDEIRDGMKQDEKDKVQTLIDASKHLDTESMMKIVETSAQRILVNYFADNKKNYDERQKEVFLTFLLTNKLQRELEREFN